LKRFVCESRGEVLPDGVAFVTVDAPFALFKIDRVRWEVPVDDGVAVGVEVEPFLAYRSRSEHEWPEGRVEGVAKTLGPRARIA